MQSPESLESKLADVGLWGETGVIDPALKERYMFAPGDVVDLDTRTTGQMHQIAAELPDAIDAMIGVMTDDTESDIQKEALKGVNSYYKTGPYWHEGMSKPPVVMIDGMVTPEGDVKIAEIDFVNPRFLGYLCMYKLLGYGNHVAQAINAAAQWVEGNNGLTILHGDMQRWYAPYFDILASELGEQGLAVEVVSESEVQGGANHGPSYLDLPILKRQSKALGKQLVAKCQIGEAAFMYPPTPWLSSKALLVHLGQLGILDGFLPKSVAATAETVEQLGDDVSQFCVKAGISSGMKGLFLPGTPEYDSTLKSIKNGSSGYILQEFVDSKVFNLKHMTDSAWQNGEFYARLSLFVDPENGELLAADMTGQPIDNGYNGVHGAPDCVLAPVNSKIS